MLSTNSATKILEEAYPDETETIEGYVNEFEHMEGTDCWENYFGESGDPDADIRHDYEMYREGVRDK